MAIMVGNGANAGSLSPFAPTGIIVTGLMTRIGMPGFEWQTYLYNLAAHALVAFGGYFLFGGWKLFASGPAQRRATRTPLPVGGRTAFERRHWLTLAIIALLIVSVIVLNVNVGMAAFAGAVVLVLLEGAATTARRCSKMPWNVIVMVCGVTVLIAVLEKAEGIDLIVSQIARFATPKLATAEIAFLTGLVSVYSSTSGVVLPAFLPMVPGLAHTDRRRAVCDCDVDERRRPSGRRLAALDDRRVVHRGRPGQRRHPRAVQQAAGVGTVDVGRRRAGLLGVIRAVVVSIC